MCSMSTSPLVTAPPPWNNDFNQHKYGGTDTLNVVPASTPSLLFPRITLTLACPMDLKNFPMDVQTCIMQLESCESGSTFLRSRTPIYPLPGRNPLIDRPLESNFITLRAM